MRVHACVFARAHDFTHYVNICVCAGEQGDFQARREDWKLAFTNFKETVDEWEDDCSEDDLQP